MTFWVTCVVVRIVTTHFRNPLVGNVPAFSLGTIVVGVTFSASLSVSVDSNQNKHVIFQTVSPILPPEPDRPTYLCSKLGQTSTTIIYCSRYL